MNDFDHVADSRPLFRESLDNSQDLEKKAKSAAYYEAHKERYKVTSAAWRAANKEKIAATGAARYAANKEQVKVTGAAYYAANTEQIKSNRSAYRAANKEQVAAWYASYRAANTGKVKAKNAAWAKSNPEKIRIFVQNRRARKISAGGTLSHGLSVKLFKLQKGKCPCCKQPLGDNYHMDHVIPLALGGANTDDNIQLLRAVCNMQKSAKHPIDFMQKRGFLI